MIEIKSRTGHVLYTAAHARDLRQAVEEAVKAGANLTRAYLTRAYLADAYLVDADLTDADLTRANLARANLTRANLNRADLTGADLTDAYLTDADLTRVYLTRAYLTRAYLADAYLAGADLAGADLTDAYLAGAKQIDLVIARLAVLPDEGDVIGWKRAAGGKIVKLRIPGDARRSNATGRKCRAETAEVLAIFDADGQPCQSAISTRDYNFKYWVGETVRPTKPFDENRWNECASGIHFYITRAEAEAHL